MIANQRVEVFFISLFGNEGSTATKSEKPQFHFTNVQAQAWAQPPQIGENRETTTCIAHRPCPKELVFSLAHLLKSLTQPGLAHP